MARIVDSENGHGEVYNRGATSTKFDNTPNTSIKFSETIENVCHRCTATQNDNSTIQMPTSTKYNDITHDVSPMTSGAQNAQCNCKKRHTSGNENHAVLRFQRFCVQSVRGHETFIRRLVVLFCLSGYVVYLAFAVKHSLDKAVPLLIITGAVIIIILYIAVRDNFGEEIYGRVCVPSNRVIEQQWYWMQWTLYGCLSILLVNYLCFSVITSWQQLQCLGGMIFFIFLPYVTCKHPEHIKWRPVVWGLTLQFVIGIAVLRWKPGYNAVKWLAGHINTIIFYSLDGAATVFGDPWFIFHPFLTVVFPLVTYIGVLIAIFYYMGWIQKFASKLGWLMDKTLGTTAIESASIAVNIFLSVLDTMLMMKPYLNKLTPSEFHCFLVGAHSTIAGFAFGLFVLFGVEPQHLLTGAVMSAPAAVAIAKLNWPETEKSVFTGDDQFKLEDGTDPNFYSAIARGAWEAGKSAMTILIQVLAFISLLKFTDDTIYWFGAKVGLELSLAKIFSYVFLPLSYIIGIDPEDAMAVANLLGLKLIANEFLGFLELGRYGREDLISDRSTAIATYAMCGFSSFGTLAIFTGVWGSVDPSKTSLVVSLIPRIMLNSNVACFLTACIAGMFYSEDIEQGGSETTLAQELIVKVYLILPSYKDLMNLLDLSY